ncbi:uncharacterized protein KIAA2012 homolog isoform X2 [Salminus brasiliensis]|uniref:uncharacterized protein KIAA2012 homolog isoform X2 n=1 Tax=Salminus brasiliensis TaxID=930266 RepID=UPI003B82F780
MKDLALSLLSRGYSQEVQPHDGGRYRRLEVYFEPEDYFNWRSQPPLLRLSSSGRLLGGVEPTPPKTYSTRRGPLILYSEDLALSSCQTNKVNRKGRASRTSTGEAEIQLHTLQDLTEAILAYGKNQSQAKVGCHTSVIQSLLPVPKRATQLLHPQHRPVEEQDYVSQPTGEGREDHAVSVGQGNSVYPRPGQVRYQPRFLCFPRPHKPPSGPLSPITQSLAPRQNEDRPHLAPGDSVISKTKCPEDPAIKRNMKATFRAAVGTQRVQMSPIPEAETSVQEELTGWPEDQTVTEHLTGYPKDVSRQWKQSAIETGGEEESRSLKPAYTNPSLGCSHLSRVNNYRRHMEGACQQGPVKQSANDTHLKRTNTQTKPSSNTFLLPPINQALPSDSDGKDHDVKDGSNPREHKDSVPRLPDIHLRDMNTATTGPKTSERCILRKVLLLLPSQMDQEDSQTHDGHHGLPEDEEEREDGLPEKKDETEDVLCRGVKQKGMPIMGGGQNELLEHGCQLNAAEQYHLIWFEPVEDKEHQSTPGTLPPFIGRKGPGKQSSMALYRQDPCEPADQPRSGIIRGSLPLELRDDTDDSEPEAQPRHRQQASFNQEDRTAEHTKAVENAAECNDAEGKRMVEVQACAPEQRSGKLKRSIENQPYSKGENAEIKSSGRTQGPPPEGGDTPGSSMPKSTSASRPQKKVLSTPTAVEEGFHKAKLKTQANMKKDTTFDSKAQSREAGGGDDAESTQIRKVKKKGEVDQQVRGKIENKHIQRKTGQTNTDMESEDTVYAADPTLGPTLKKKKTTAVTEKPKELANQPKEPMSQPRESTKPQNNVKKVKKKTKGQAAFVVGKPRQSQAEKEGNKPERPERTASNTEESKPEHQAEHDHCCIAHKHSLDIDQASVYKEDCTDACSPRTHSSAVSVRTQSSAAVSARTHSPAAASARTHSSAAASARTHSPAAASTRTHSPAAASTRTHSSAAASTRTHSSAAASTRTHSSAAASTRTHSPAGVSSRTHSSTAVHTDRERSRRTRKAADTEACSPAPLSLAQMPCHSTVPTHHTPSNPAKSESSVQAKSAEEAAILRESKAAALAEKAERRRLEVERKRKEKEDERKRQEEREEREERMRLELEEDQRQRAEQTRLKKLREEEDRRMQEDREMERQKRERAEMARERRRQEEKRRLLERLQRERQEEDNRRAAELKRQQQEEEARRELERIRLQEMEESERTEYLRRQREEEEEKKKAAEERRRAEEEAAQQAEEEARLLAELFARQRAALEQQLKFHRSLFVETEGLEQTQDVSRPWVFSYFSLLKLLGLVEPPEDLVKDVL